MKLKDYFASQRHVQPDQAVKLAIYEQFLTKKSRATLGRFSLVMKMSAYGLFVIALIGGLYSPLFFNLSTPLSTKVGDGFVVTQEAMRTNGVQADYVGKIINFKGDFQIIKNGEPVQTDLIQDGDRVLLTNAAEIVFDINSGMQAKIVGPAEFFIKFVGETEGVKNYVLNMVHGNYGVITSSNSNNALTLKTAGFEVESSDTSKLMNYAFSPRGKNTVVSNKGGDLLIRKTINNKKVVATLKTNQTIALNETIKTVEEFQQLAAQFKTKTLAQSYELDSESASLLASSQAVDNEQVAHTLFTQSKKVMDADQSKQLGAMLYPQFLKDDVENLALYYLQGQSGPYGIAYHNLAGRVKKIYELLGLKTESSIVASNLDSLKLDSLMIALDQLSVKLDESYYVEPLYVSRIKKLLSWVIVLKKSEFGSLPESSDVYADLGISPSQFSIR